MSIKAMTEAQLVCLIAAADQLRFGVESSLREKGLNCRVRYSVYSKQSLLGLRLSGTRAGTSRHYTIRLDELLTLLTCDYVVLKKVFEGIAARIMTDLGESEVNSPLFAPCDTCQESRRVGNKPCPDCTETVT